MDDDGGEMKLEEMASSSRTRRIRRRKTEKKDLYIDEELVAVD